MAKEPQEQKIETLTALERIAAFAVGFNEDHGFLIESIMGLRGGGATGTVWDEATTGACAGVDWLCMSGAAVIITAKRTADLFEGSSALLA